MKKRYEVWAKFENGMQVKVETHKNEKNAKLAVDSMNHHNQYELSIGYGFPYGVPAYEIIEKKVI